MQRSVCQHFILGETTASGLCITPLYNKSEATVNWVIAAHSIKITNEALLYWGHHPGEIYRKLQQWWVKWSAGATEVDRIFWEGWKQISCSIWNKETVDIQSNAVVLKTALFFNPLFVNVITLTFCKLSHSAPCWWQYSTRRHRWTCASSFIFFAQHWL